MKHYDAADHIWEEEEEKKNMAFTCCNYWRAAGPDWLVSFVSAAHQGPVEKLPLELGGGGGEVMDCALLASQPPLLFVSFLSLLQRGRRVLGCQTDFFITMEKWENEPFRCRH